MGLMKIAGITVLAFVFLFALASVIALTTKSSYTTLIRIETEEQYQEIISGDEPIITFVSLRDTPYAEEVKILKVKYHTTLEHFWHSGAVIDDWLGEMGIRNYPELVR